MICKIKVPIAHFLKNVLLSDKFSRNVISCAVYLKIANRFPFLLNAYFHRMIIYAFARCSSLIIVMEMRECIPVTTFV